MEISAYELFEILVDYCDKDVTAVIQITNCLINTLDKNTKNFRYNLMNEVEEFAMDNNLCKFCGEELIINIQQESRGEFFGTPSQETMYEKICSNGCEQE